MIVLDPVWLVDPRRQAVILKIKWRRILNIIWRKLGYGNPRRRQSQPAQP